MANRTVTAELEMKGKDATGPMWKSVAARMGQMEKQFGRFNRTAEQFNSKIKNIERTTSAMARVSRGVEASSAMALGAVSRFAAPAAIAYGMKQAVVSFADMERHMARIGVTAEASKGEVADATKEVERLSMAMGYDTFDPAISALDTLVSSGMNLKDAMSFLPSVLATAQASGAATEDIANTAMKASSALQIQAGQMQNAFDIMVAGGKAGQFELRDMSQYIPNLANLWSSLGYRGTDGLKQLVAVLQTIREDTGNAADAATYAENVFIKMNTAQTKSNFKKFGVDLDKEFSKAKKNGEDMLTAFIRISKEALKGDLTKLPMLFTDSQVLLGMQSLLTSEESLQRFLAAVNNAKVNGTVMRDLDTVLEGTKAKIDRLNLSWSKFLNAVGSAASGPVGGVLDAATSQISKTDALHEQLRREGMSYAEILAWEAKNAPFPWSDGYDLNTKIFKGGYRDPQFVAHYMEQFADTPGMQKMKGRGLGSLGQFPPIDHGYTPKNLPIEGPYPFPGNMPRDQHLREVYGNTGGRMSGTSSDFTMYAGAPGEGIDWKRFFFGDMADGGGLIDHMKIDLSGAGQEAGQALGQAASDKINSDAATAGDTIGQRILSALNSWKPNINISGYSGNQGVNANVGKPATVTPPATSGQPNGGGW